MLLSDNVRAENNFAKAYNSLNAEDKARVRESIMICCEVTERTVYSWIENPNLVVGKLHKRYIAYLIFNKPIKEFFENGK